MKPSSMVLRLCKKLKEEVGFDADPTTFRRTRAGYWQKSQGAFSWVIRARGGWREIGCCDAASEVVKKKWRFELLCDRDGWVNEIVAER